MKELDSKTLNELLNTLTKDSPRIIREEIGPPASEEQIKETLTRVKELLEKRNTNNIDYSNPGNIDEYYMPQLENIKEKN